MRLPLYKLSQANPNAGHLQAQLYHAGRHLLELKQQLKGAPSAQAELLKELIGKAQTRYYELSKKVLGVG